MRRPILPFLPSKIHNVEPNTKSSTLLDDGVSWRTATAMLTAREVNLENPPWLIPLQREQHT